MGNNDEIDNIFIDIPRFLINLKIYDMDGEQLSLLTNEYTHALIEDRIDTLNYQIRKQEQKELTDYYREIRDHKRFLLWIKLPPTKKINKGKLRMITLEYDAEREEKTTGKFELDFPNNESHDVFYTIRKPNDYEFSKIKIETTAEKNKIKKYKGKNDPDFPIYVSTGFDSIAMAKKSKIKTPTKVRYSFKPDKNITAAPLTMAGWFYIIPLYVIIGKLCTGTCFQDPIPAIDSLVDRKLELGLGIITASLVLPTLINNQHIRNDLRVAFYVPIILSIIMILAF